MIDQCPKCRRDLPAPNHKCLPFECRQAEDDYVSTVWCEGDEESAAEDYLESRHADFEYPDVEIVCVRRPGGEWKKFRVDVEAVWQFSAYELTKEAAP